MPSPVGKAVVDAAFRAQSGCGPVARSAVDRFIRSHYLGRWPGVVTACLGFTLGGALVGCCVFALPPRETHRRYGVSLSWELARFYLVDAMPNNAETFFCARAIRYIKRTRRDVAALVSYADPSVGHAGTIYKAGGWRSDGRTDQERKTPRFDYVDAVTGKHYSRRAHVPGGAHIVRKPRVSKWRFVFPMASSCVIPTVRVRALKTEATK